MMYHGQSDRLDEFKYSADTIHSGLVHISNDFHIHFDPLTLHFDCLIDNRIFCHILNEYIHSYAIHWHSQLPALSSQLHSQIKNHQMDKENIYIHINNKLMECIH